MRRPFVFLLPVLLGQCVDGSMPALITPPAAQRIAISSLPIDVSGINSRIGALTLIGAWQLTSDARSFGGLSALDVSGNRVTAVGDGGSVVRFRFGRFGAASDASIVRVPEGCGRVSRKTDNDTESLAHDSARGQWWIGFEWRNVICRTNRDFSKGEGVAAPQAMANWQRKRGPETMLRLADGRFLVIAEAAPGGGSVRPMLVFDRDPTDPAAVVTNFGYRPPQGYSPTDAAQLPDGRILVLNRRFSLWSLFSSAVTLIDAPSARTQATTPIVAQIDAPNIAENYEGLSVTTENGRTIVWMISDDNFMRWQRTKLLKFALN